MVPSAQEKSLPHLHRLSDLHLTPPQRMAPAASAMRSSAIRGKRLGATLDVDGAEAVSGLLGPGHVQEFFWMGVGWCRGQGPKRSEFDRLD